MLKNKCLKALDILKVVSSTDWGAECDVLLNLYRSLVRSKLDYGCFIYGSARKSYVKILDTIHHQGLRLCLGAFRTTPVNSLYVEANEPCLYQRSVKLALQYATKLKAYPGNPAHDCVFKPLYENIFEKHPNKIQPFGIRIKPHLNNSGINLDEIAAIEIPHNPPWLNPKPVFIFDLRNHKKSDTNPLIIQQHFAEIKSHYPDHSAIYTDGSKDGDKVASAAVFGERVETRRLPSASSVFSAEAQAILLALKIIASSDESKFIICSDSLSCLQAIENSKIKNPFILKIIQIYKSLTTLGKEVVFFWIPSHVGIYGSTVVDREAKNALNNDIINCKIPFTDFKSFILKYIFSTWQSGWDLEVHNKLREIQPLLHIHNLKSCRGRRDQVVLSRCRLGHTRTTHNYILNGEPRPECVPCDSPYTIKHVLMDCVDVAHIRERFYTVDSYFNLFTTVAGDKILQFLKEINLYNKI